MFLHRGLRMGEIVESGSFREDQSPCRIRPSVVSLLAVLEEENRELKGAVIDLALEMLLLREAICRRER